MISGDHDVEQLFIFIFSEFLNAERSFALNYRYNIHEINVVYINTEGKFDDGEITAIIQGTKYDENRNLS